MLILQWKEHSEKLLNPVDMPSLQWALQEISGVLESIFVAEIIMAVSNLHNDMGAGVEEIRPEMLKALQWVLWVTSFFNVA